jgi:hypothetical protein
MKKYEVIRRVKEQASIGGKLEPVPSYEEAACWRYVQIESVRKLERISPGTEILTSEGLDHLEIHCCPCAVANYPDEQNWSNRLKSQCVALLRTGSGIEEFSVIVHPLDSYTRSLELIKNENRLHLRHTPTRIRTDCAAR